MQEENEIVHVEGRPSQKLQKMQVISANHLHPKKEIRKEDFCKQQEEGGDKNIIKVGDQTECPECKRSSRIVWVSKDGKTAGIRCPASHSLTNRPESRLGSVTRPQPKTSRNMVFITKIEQAEAPPASLLANRSMFKSELHI
jgi:hypothetical protein